MLISNVIALDGSRQRAHACDVAVEGGRIAAVLPAGSCDGAATVDGKGRLALIPGFVNAHTHAAMTLLRGLGEEKALQEWLEKEIWPVERRLKKRDIYVGTLLAMVEMASCGVTCFGDMYFFMDEVAKAALEVGMRCGICQGIIGAEERTLKIGLALADEWNGRGGLVSVQLGPHAPYTVPPDMMAEVAKAARERGLGVHVHWLETEWELNYIEKELGRDPVFFLSEVGLLDVSSLVLAHGVWFPRDRLNEIAKSNVAVVHNPSSNLKLGSGVMPMPEMLECGVNVALGSDGAASNNRLDVWGEMRTAALLHKGLKRDPSCVTALQVLNAATYEGAKALGFADVGRICEGWQADLVLVDLDRPHYVGWDLDSLAGYLVYAGSSADVKATMVAGRWIYKDGEFLGADTERVMEEAAGCRKRLVGR
ncbi:amidohydrolase [Acetomicrobium sp. S15 = DSM 107314]|uniref:amidohydrolase n=1 Tax=Acetomicrobium sp. S15 = DSM 107314 TaxID=2529858 RepID=UPI0018E1B30C|nr:amidohydrolase [Acetomicrobium sp. S15 = DSM 107314]